MGDQVPKQVIQERFDRLVALQGEISLERNRRLLGRRLEVMVEGPSRKDPTVATTRTRGGLPLHVEIGPGPGAYLEVEVTRAAPHHLHGSLRP